MEEQIKTMFETEFEDLSITQVQELLLFWKFIQKIIPVIRNQAIDDCAKIAERAWYNLEPSAGKPIQQKHIPLDPKMCTQLELFGFINCLGGIRAREMEKLKEVLSYSPKNDLLEEIVEKLHKEMFGGMPFIYEKVADVISSFREQVK